MPFWPIAAAVVVSAAAIIGSTSILLLGSRAERAAVWILCFAIGTLLGGASLHLLPEALESLPADEVMLVFVGGLVLFITLERAIRWRHTHLHEDEQRHHAEATAQVLLWGDALHNFIDGLVLGVTFSVSTELGMIATVAVFAHEVPQEIGDFAVLLQSGMPRRRALLLNYLSAVTVIPGAVAGWLWSSSFETAIVWLLPFAAAGFIYIALADLVPSLHHSHGRWVAAAQIALIVLGVAVIHVTGAAFHHD
ncbi:MAG TPA: ZIP family metal transporter [Thermoanaerobaculia bacterium]|nr:ZIP family metal transporter [Thermoanaerobaculia bacterium]